MSEIKQSHIKNTDFTIKAKIIIISDSLSKLKDWQSTDKSGKIAKAILEQNKIKVIDMFPIADAREKIAMFVQQIIDEKNIDFILTIGGTGIAKRDVTIEAIRPLLEKELAGFGELFRSETYKELKTMSIMTRTLAGVTGTSLICCLPGSPNAVKLGTNLILQEILHILNLIKPKSN